MIGGPEGEVNPKFSQVRRVCCRAYAPLLLNPLEPPSEEPELLYGAAHETIG